MNPEGRSAKTREQILEESPLLSALVDPVILLSLDTWQERFDDAVAGRGVEILKAIGEKINDMDLNNLYGSLNLNSVFKPEIGDSHQITLMVIYSLIGFEVGNRDDLLLFGEEMVKPIIAIGAVHDSSETRRCFMQAAMCGVNWREDVENEVPSSIRESLRQIVAKL